MMLLPLILRTGRHPPQSLWYVAVQQLHTCLSRTTSVTSQTALTLPHNTEGQHRKFCVWNSHQSGAVNAAFRYTLNTASFLKGTQLVCCQGAQQQLVQGHVRHKSKKSKTKKEVEDSDDEGSDMDDALDDDDFDAPTNFKIITIHVSSTRSDAIVCNSLNIARNRLDEIFLGSGLLLNGEKMSKKGGKLDEGDYVDVIGEKLEDQYKVRRAKVLKIYPVLSSSGKTKVKVRVWKSAFLIAKPKHRHS